MKAQFLPAILLALVAMLLLACGHASAAEAKADPKTLFTTLKCNSCHAISAQGVAVVEDEAESEEEEDEDSAKPRDLSDAGVKRDAKWLKDWLLKKVDVQGKKHRKKFEGTPAQLDALATWLAGLKDAPKK